MSAMSPTKGRTVSRERWIAAQAAWETGGFESEWHEWRHLAAMEAGIIDPPIGSEWDSWADEDPSQRAILIRAVRETPELLRSAIRAPGVHSWAAVIAVLLRGRDATGEDVTLRVRDDEQRRVGEPTRAQAAATLRRVGSVIDDADREHIRRSVRAGECPTCGQSWPSAGARA